MALNKVSFEAQYNKLRPRSNLYHDSQNKATKKDNKEKSILVLRIGEGKRGEV